MEGGARGGWVPAALAGTDDYLDPLYSQVGGVLFVGLLNFIVIDWSCIGLRSGLFHDAVPHDVMQHNSTQCLGYIGLLDLQQGSTSAP